MQVLSEIGPYSTDQIMIRINKELGLKVKDIVHKSEIKEMIEKVYEYNKDE